MKSPQKALALSFIIAATMCLPLLAGIPDNAPFEIAPPDAGWKLDDSTPHHQLGKGPFLAASLVNEKKDLKSIVITGPIKPSAKALDESCAIFRSAWTNPTVVEEKYRKFDFHVKKLSDAEITFLGFKAQALAYESTQAGETTYFEVRVFIVGDVLWILSFSGPLAQKDAIKQMITFYRPKRA